MEFFLIYVYLVFSKIAFATEPLIIFGLVSTALLIFGEIMLKADSREGQKDFEAGKECAHYRTKLLKWVVIPAIIIACLIPTKEDIAWIVGGGVAWNIASTEEAQKLPDNVLGAVNRFLESLEEEEDDE